MRVRNFAWADLPPLVELMNLVRRTGKDERVVSLSSVREELAQPGLSPDENCILFEDDQGLRAASIIHPELPVGRAVLELCIDPGITDKGTIKDVVRSALARAKELGAKVLHVCVPPSEMWKDLLEAEGLSLIRAYWLMKWQRETVPGVQVPDGFSIENFKRGDEDRLTRVQNASFSGSWGFCPNTVEEVSYRVSMSICDPEGILFLNDGDHNAGFCWTLIQGESGIPVGVIGMIGIHPNYRGRGLSRPILLAGMKFLHSKAVKHIRLDVDGQNIPAVKLYTSVGFEKAQELHWFEARLSEG